MKNPPQLKKILSRAAVGVTLAVAATTGWATPYATSLTNNAGTVSFRLNQTTATNDTILVISGGGTVTNVLQSPANNPANIVTRGLVVTNLGIAAGTFQVYIKHVGSGVISTNSPRFAFGSPRGITANRNPASPYFGWIYVSNSATNASGRGDGLFAFSADFADVLGQGLVPKNGGITAFPGSANSPYRISIAPDDSVLVCDFADISSDLYSLPPLLNSFSYVLKKSLTNSLTGAIGATPVGVDNNHGSLSSARIVGTGANTILYTMDEDYQRDPTAGGLSEANSVWRYNIGTGPFPWSNAPDAKLMSPNINAFQGQNQGLDVGPNGWVYVCQRRSNPPQYGLYICDPANPVDPNTYSGSQGGYFYNSQDASIAVGYGDDVFREINMITVSKDGRWIAGIANATSGNFAAPDGSIYANQANDIIVIPLTNGIPNIPALQKFKPGSTTSSGRDLTFDAANNLIFASSGIGVAQSLDLGESTEATTGADGTFSLATPPTQVVVQNINGPVASESGTAGIFTITRSTEDIGNPMSVVFTLGGSASNGVDYVSSATNSVVLAAGQTSTNITITPVDDSIPELTETVVLTLKVGANYSLGFPFGSTIALLDNELPQLQILSLSTNVYQGTTNDYAAIAIRRFGDTSGPVVLDASSFAFGGTAVSNVDYVLGNLPATIPGGVVDFTNALVFPGLSGSTAVGTRTILLTNLAVSGYTVTNNTAATTLVLKAVPTEVVLFADNFENTDSATNYRVAYGTYTNAPADNTVLFGYDYTSASAGNLAAIPPAPHSTNGDTHGLFLTVNKGDGLGVAAGLNVYMTNAVFSNSFALRFDMFLVQNSSGSAISKAEAAVFGINHGGDKTNWFRNAVSGTDLIGSTPTASDGIWFSTGTDGAGGGGTQIDFGAWTGPTYTNSVNIIGPTNFLSRLATSTRQIFKKPPFDAGTAAGGIPANTVINPTPTWSEVEVSRVVYPNLISGTTNLGPGVVITWKINNSVVLTYAHPNTNALRLSALTNGMIMLGYVDPWDDIANGSAGSGEAGVIYDNVRVVSITPPTIVSQPSSIVAAAGTVTNLSVLASTGTGTTSYQWLLNGTNLVGQTGPTLNFAPLAFTNFGTYSVIASDGAYNVQSTNVTVLPTTPLLNTQPVSRAALLGSTLNPAFSTLATTFSGRTNYQWFTNTPAGLIANRTNVSLSLTNIQSVNLRPYFVTVSDGFNVITSSVVNLTLAAQPTITSPTLGAGGFGLNYTSEGGLNYVVDFKSALTNATWIPIKTNAGTGGIISVTNTAAGDQGYYRVRIQ